MTIPPPTPAERVDVEERRQQVLILARQGRSYRQIGTQLGISHTQARRDLDAALKEHARPVADGVRKMHIIRAEWIYEQAARVVVNATNNDQRLRALDRCSVALERLARLDGVDAPTRQQITVLSLDAINSEIAALEAELAAGGVVLDAVIVDDIDQ